MCSRTDTHTHTHARTCTHTHACTCMHIYTHIGAMHACTHANTVTLILPYNSWYLL